MRILSLTSTRSDYDLMSSLYRELNVQTDFELRLIVAGTHISGHHGKTLGYILEDSLVIQSNVENLYASDHAEGQARAFGKLFNESLEPILDYRPDLGFVVGDREDALAFAAALTYLGIPFAHFYGGDHASDGHVDNRVRHAISKLASLHFVSTYEHRKRLLAIGEELKRIEVIGSLSIDNLRNEPMLRWSHVLHEISNARFSPDKKVALLLYHSMPEEDELFGEIFTPILELLTSNGYQVVIGQPNHDPGHLKIIHLIEQVQNMLNVCVIKSLPRSLFVNLLRNLDLIIGNSSLGVLEASTFQVPVINIGKRQRGRLSAENVIFSDMVLTDIAEALQIVHSQQFLNRLSNVNNPYGDGRSTARVIELLKRLSLSNIQNKAQDPLINTNSSV